MALAVFITAAGLVAAILSARKRFADERSARLALDEKMTRLTTCLFNNDRTIHKVLMAHKKSIEDLYVVLEIEDDKDYVRFDDNYAPTVQ